MSYRIQRFSVAQSNTGTGQSFGQQLNRWLAINDDITVIGMTVSMSSEKIGPKSVIVHVAFRRGGCRHYAYEFSGTQPGSVSDQVQAFFDYNQGFTSVTSASIQPSTLLGERLVVIYVAERDLIRRAVPGAYPYWTPVADVAVGAYGQFANNLDPFSPQVQAMNVGNQLWQAGAPGVLCVNVDGCPDADIGQTFTIGGLAAECGVVWGSISSPSVWRADCGCSGSPFSFSTSTVTNTTTTAQYSTTAPVTTTTSTTTNTYPTTTDTTTTTLPPPPVTPPISTPDTSTTTTTTTTTATTTTTTTTTTSTTTTEPPFAACSDYPVGCYDTYRLSLFTSPVDLVMFDGLVDISYFCNEGCVLYDLNLEAGLWSAIEAVLRQYAVFSPTETLVSLSLTKPVRWYRDPYICADGTACSGGTYPFDLVEDMMSMTIYGPGQHQMSLPLAAAYAEVYFLTGYLECTATGSEGSIVPDVAGEIDFLWNADGDTSTLDVSMVIYDDTETGAGVARLAVCCDGYDPPSINQVVAVYSGNTGGLLADDPSVACGDLPATESVIIRTSTSKVFIGTSGSFAGNNDTGSNLVINNTNVSITFTVTATLPCDTPGHILCADNPWTAVVAPGGSWGYGGSFYDGAYSITWAPT